MLNEKIRELRNKSNLTQKELADKLCVTAQAVSRWESGEVEPSVSTIKEMSEIFNVSIDEIMGKEQKAEEPPKEVVREEPRPVLAVCEKCNKPIYNGNEIVRVRHGHRGGTTTEIRCKACDEKIKKREKEIKIEEANERRRKSFVWGTIITVIALGVAIGVVCSSDLTIGVNVCLIVAAVLFFPFISCLFLDNNFIGDVVSAIASWGFIKFPGLIFELDLDGIVWLLTVKLLFWIIGLSLAVLSTLFGVALGLVLSLFVYPFALKNNIKNPLDD